MVVTERLRARARQVLEKDEREPVPSPCQSICSMDAKDGLCLGCLRTLQEIAQWSQASPQDKRLVWQKIQSRLEPVTNCGAELNSCP